MKLDIEQLQTKLLVPVLSDIALIIFDVWDGL